MPPRGWGGDELSRFIGHATNNVYATYERLPGEYRLLSDIDSAFHRLASNSHANARVPIPAMLMLHSHAVFRGGCRFALSGQAASTYMQLRGCIEGALYASYMFRHPEAQEVWLNRHVSEDSQRMVRETFSYGNMRRDFEQVDKKTSDILARLYSMTLDFGAHPNEQALTGNMTKSTVDGREQFNVVYLHEFGPSLLMALKLTMSCGVSSMDVFRTMYSERFDLLGISPLLETYKTGINEMGKRWKRELDTWRAEARANEERDP